MPTPNPAVQAQLERAQAELAAARAEKTRLFPPNPDPLGKPDLYPSAYTPAQIEQRNQLNERIEMLEQQVQELQDRLYLK